MAVPETMSAGSFHRIVTVFGISTSSSDFLLLDPDHRPFLLALGISIPFFARQRIPHHLTWPKQFWPSRESALERLSFRLRGGKLLTNVGRANRYRCYAQPLREILPTEEQCLRALFDKSLALFEPLLHHLDPARPVPSAFLRDAREVCHPFIGGKIVRKLSCEAMKPLLARGQSAPRTVHVEGVPNSLASFGRCGAGLLEDPSNR